jgi:hypothetical protein
MLTFEHAPKKMPIVHPWKISKVKNQPQIENTWLFYKNQAWNV